MKKKGNFTKADLALLGIGMNDDEVMSKHSGLSPNHNVSEMDGARSRDDSKQRVPYNEYEEVPENPEESNSKSLRMTQ